MNSFKLLRSSINSISIRSNKLYLLNNRAFCREDVKQGDNTEEVSFIFKYLADGKEVKVTSNIGKSILNAAHANKIDLEGACDSSLACSTCHVILDDEIFDSIPEAKEEEDDLLDLAFGLTHTSRLGCQVLLTKQFEGRVIEIPAATKNLYVDGHKPQPH